MGAGLSASDCHVHLLLNRGLQASDFVPDSDSNVAYMNVRRVLAASFD